MKNILLVTLILSSLLFSKRVEPKVVYAEDKSQEEEQKEEYEEYSHSTEEKSDTNGALLSTVQVSSQISLEISTQMTVHNNSTVAQVNFLDKNRLQIMEEIAQGEGEHITTLLEMMELNYNPKSLKTLQSSFNQLIYLSHEDFLEHLNALNS